MPALQTKEPCHLVFLVQRLSLHTDSERSARVLEAQAQVGITRSNQFPADCGCGIDLAKTEQAVVSEGPARGTCCGMSCLALKVSTDSGNSVTHCECASHSFRTARSGIHRATEEQAALRGTADSCAGRAAAADADRKVWTRQEKNSQGQMQLFELEPVVSEMIEQAESEHAAVHRWTKKIVKHPGRLPGKSVELRSTGQPGAAIPTQARSPPAKSKKQETEIELE